MNTSPITVPTSGIRYLGWSRSNVAPTSGAFLGHPAGDVMKISPYNQNAASNATPITWTLCPNPPRVAVSPVNTHWTATINDGGLQGGSSGGPFFDQNRRVVGQLHGGQIGCAPRVAHAGRFDVSWTGGGTANTRLSTWLTNDPSVMTTNTLPIPFITASSGSGYPVVCGTAVGFNLNNAPSTATHSVTWTVSPNLLIISQGSASVLLRYSGSQNGTGTITANITSTNPGLCSVSTPISLNVQAGPFTQSQVIVSGQAGVCNGNAYNYYANVTGGYKSGYTYSWSYPSGWSVFSQYQNSIRLYVPLYNPQYGVVSASINNGCGASGYSGITVYPGFGCSSYSYSYFPNPGKDELTVEVVDPSSGKPIEEDTTVQFRVAICDSQQKVLSQGMSLGNKAILSLRSISKGTYFLRIFDDNQTITERLVVE